MRVLFVNGSPNRNGNTAALALLLEGRRGDVPRGLERTFDL